MARALVAADVIGHGGSCGGIDAMDRSDLHDLFLLGLELLVDLADALGTSPKLWMNLQATYDLDKAARARRAA